MDSWDYYGDDPVASQQMGFPFGFGFRRPFFPFFRFFPFFFFPFFFFPRRRRWGWGSPWWGGGWGW
ncbi:MAG: hypothetical protein HPY55_05965 [Firmicutes bacterium]|nr:hypothetical protein [Bacillota bacterium]